MPGPERGGVLSERMVRSPAKNVLRLVSPPSAPTEAPTEEPVLDDAALLTALARGDETAARSLYLRTRPHVERTVQRLLGRGDSEHDDVVQGAMIAVVSSIGRFRGESSLDTWVGRVTANTVFKAIRKRRHDRRLVVVDEEGVALAASPRATSADVEARDLVHRVRTILAAMDPVKAYTVMLFDVCGYDVREIAEITEASAAAAQSRLVRGRAELHERIEKDPELAELLERRVR